MVEPMPRESTRPLPNGRYTAIRPERDMTRPLPAALSWTVLLVFAVAFTAMVVVLGTPRWLTALYGVMSVIAFFAYGFDKSAAMQGGQRVSEQTLLTLGFAGGWPGALVAQQIFRHKTRKRSFRRRFWVRVVVNVLLLAALVVATTLGGWDLQRGWQSIVALF